MRKDLDRLEIGGVILAGGQARRLGGLAKGRIEVGGNVSIVEQLISELKNAGICNIIIAANDPIPYLHFDIEVVPDIRKGIGPLGGIETGLVHFTGQSDAVMFVPCDMPNITSKEMLTLKEAFMETEKPVVFAGTAGFFWHPLCAVVHNRLKNRISSAIDDGQRKVRDIWQQLKAETVLFDDNTAFFNINNFEDIHRWEKEYRNEKENMYGNFDSRKASGVSR
ncbi:MAG: molybdenum cofactor guanylyltransferase [Sedimentisphaerales bacterium]|nr:molybdenum cofactor guanylyltransferase [Sedimentisphaerales bacterium]